MRRLVVWFETRHAANVAKANPWPTGSGAITTRTKGATMTSNPLRSDSQPLAASERPIPPEAPESPSWVLDDALRRIERLWDVIAANGTTNSRLIRERDAARVELADLRTRLAERDAQVGRLTKRLSEGQG